ncbi:MAG: glycosyltransferase family 4 protein [Chloroflexota bacterium]|nr:glycosyltransferase family 4 protein [Chloroflexota bacterium]
MRILMLNYEFPPLGAGGATSSFNLARNVVRLGHHVDVVTMGFRGVQRREVLDGVHVYRVPSLRSRKEVCHTHEMATYVFSGAVEAARLARRHAYDVCNAHFIFPTGPIAFGLRRVGRLPYVLTARGSDVPGHNPNRFRFDHQLLGPVWRGLVRDADAVAAVSEHLKSRIQAHAPDVDVDVIPNGCSPLGDDGAEPPAGGPASEAHRNGKLRVLSVSRLHEFKGVQYLLAAAERVPLDLEINIVGDGPYRATLEYQAARGQASVRFWGWLDRDAPELRRLYQTSSIFVFPSEREGSPTVIQEAMSAGMAVIAADSAGTPEVVGDAGILVSPKDTAGIADALVRLATHPDEADDLGRRAQERVRREFDWPTLAARYVDLYARTAARARRIPRSRK